MEAAFKDADIVYAKSWGAMVHTPDAEEGAEIIKKYATGSRMSGRWLWRNRMRSICIPLPADRNIEVTDGVMDGPIQWSMMKQKTACTLKKP